MVRSLSTVILLLAVTGLVWGQPFSPPPPAPTGGEQILTVHETGKPGQRSRVLRVWQTPEGMRAYLVQALETGEMMTIVETGQTKTVSLDTGLKATTTTIYHWSADGRPPRGTPLPPGYTMPAVAAAPTSAPPVAQAVTPKPPVVPASTTTAVQQPAMIPPPVVSQAVPVPSPRPSVAPNSTAFAAQPTVPPAIPAASPKPPVVPAPTTVAVQQNTPLPPPPAPVASPRPAVAPTSTNVATQQTMTPPPSPVMTTQAAPSPTAAAPARPAPSGLVQASATVPAPTVPPPSPSPRLVPQPAVSLPPAQVTPGPVAAAPAPTSSCAPTSCAPPPCCPCKPCPEPTPPLRKECGPSSSTCSTPSPTSSSASTASNSPYGTIKTVPVTTNPPTAIAAKDPKADGSVGQAATVEPAQPTDWRQSWGKTATAPPTVPAPSSTSKRDPATPYAKATPLQEAPKADKTERPARVTPVAETSSYDPLNDPENYLRRPLPDRKEGAKDDSKPSPPYATPTPASPASDGPPRPFEAALTKTAPPAPAEARPAEMRPVVPLGTASVLAAGSVQYLPVPIVTLPDQRNAPRLPEPPSAATSPTTEQANAFPVSPVPPPSQGPAEDVNAFTAPAPREPQGVAWNGYNPVGPSSPAPLPSAPLPPALPPKAQVEELPTAVMPAALPTSYGTPAAALPTSYPALPEYPVPTSTTAAQTFPSKASPAAPLLAQLRDSLMPSERELAVLALSKFDVRACPEVVQALIAAAQQDPAPGVRVASVRSLARMGAHTEVVMTVLQSMQSDSDPRVRQEVDQALQELNAMLNGAASQGAGQPAAAPVPQLP